MHVRANDSILTKAHIASVIECNSLTVDAPFKWLRLGTNDLLMAGKTSILYGLAFYAISCGVTFIIFKTGNELLIFPMMLSFLLIAPVLSTGLYDISKQIQHDHEPSLTHTFQTLMLHKANIIGMSFLLMLIMIFWMRMASIIHIMYPADITNLSLSALAPFLITGSLVGACFMMLVFTISAFSIPLMIERHVDLVTAILTSVHAVHRNWKAMFVWAAIISIVMLISFATFYLAMIVLLPILGHATWHGYQETVVTSVKRKGVERLV